MKNGWKTRISVGLATPRPAVLEIPKPLAYHVVIESGTRTSKTRVPLEDLHEYYKNWFIPKPAPLHLTRIFLDDIIQFGLTK